MKRILMLGYSIAVASQPAAFKICQQTRKFFINQVLCQVKHLCTNWWNFKTLHIETLLSAMKLVSWIILQLTLHIRYNLHQKSWCIKVHIGPCQLDAIELFCGNCQELVKRSHHTCWNRVLKTSLLSNI